MIGIDGSSIFGGTRVGLDAEHGSQLLITSPAGSGDHLAVVVVFDDPHWYICVLSARSGKLVSRFRTHFAVSQIYYARLPEGEDCIVAIEGSEECVCLHVGRTALLGLSPTHPTRRNQIGKGHLLAPISIGEEGCCKQTRKNRSACLSYCRWVASQPASQRPSTRSRDGSPWQRGRELGFGEC